MVGRISGGATIYAAPCTGQSPHSVFPRLNPSTLRITRHDTFARLQVQRYSGLILIPPAKMQYAVFICKLRSCYARRGCAFVLSSFFIPIRAVKHLKSGSIWPGEQLFTLLFKKLSIRDRSYDFHLLAERLRF